MTVISEALQADFSEYSVRERLLELISQDADAGFIIGGLLDSELAKDHPHLLAGDVAGYRALEKFSRADVSPEELEYLDNSVVFGGIAALSHSVETTFDSHSASIPAQRAA
ncbi:MAG TPA: hypothetical protein VG604_04755 [Candidatus Saccharimonadales bacterium]|nr:hypothetical protein [Candidatus Saccharimonadales bacterium]